MSSILARSAVARIALAGAAALAVALPALADDIDVYRAQLAGGQKPNILFVLDYSGSMNQDVHGAQASGSGLPRKIDILRDAMAEVLTANSGRIRVGVSQYATEVSGVRWPISDLDVDAHEIDPAIPAGTLTARDAINRQLDRRDAGGWTPTVNALAEAAMYFRGGTVAHGGDDPLWSPRHRPDRWDSASGSYAGGNASAAIEASYTPRPAYLENVFEAGSYDYCNDYSPSDGTNHCSGHAVYDCETREADSDKGHLRCKYGHPDHWAGAEYVSPITQSCQANAIVLISDGLPNSTSDNATLQEVAGTDLAGCEDVSTGIFGAPSDTTDPNGNCGPEIVRALAGNPQVSGVPDSTVRTYTVGFSVESSGQDYLRLLASEGKGEFFAADRPEELVAALEAIVEDVATGTESFVELAVDVDRASFSHDDRAFFSLFEPGRARAWRGNLKGYFLDGGTLRDVNGADALVAGAGGARFAPGAQSFWSATPDGDEVTVGGASGRLASGTRRLYTYLGDSAAISSAGVALAGVAERRLESANGAITDAHLGLPAGSAARAAALDWLATAPMGDPLHSKSVSVDYGSRQVVYVMTNQGLIHAIDASAPTAGGDASGGEELFAFMPKRLLANLPVLASDPTGDEHVYGLDGAITRWHVDADGDGVVDGGDSVLLVFGMRRGGEAYYALDVTDPTAPRLMWVIDSATPGFERLAQSWSRMSLVRVKRDAGEGEVLVFGGGYDASTLDEMDKRRDARGNAIFVVDRDGELVASFDKGDHGSMKYSFAADLTVIDSDSDGLADRIYAADVGGQVWRIDFDNIDDTSGSGVTRLADLDGNGTQPFFSAPSVALNRGGTGGDFLSIALGSGDRTEPLETDSRNAFFMLRDTDVDRGPPASGFNVIRAGDLYDASANALGSDDATLAEAAREALAGARGWRVELAAGEKSLSRLVSFEGKLIATTFEPDSSAGDPCAPTSTARFYIMDLFTARPLALDADGESDTADGAGFSSNPAHRSRTLSERGIPSRPLVLFPKGSDEVQVLVGRERVGVLGQNPTRVYWHSR